MTSLRRIRTPALSPSNTADDGVSFNDNNNNNNNKKRRSSFLSRFLSPNRSSTSANSNSPRSMSKSQSIRTSNTSLTSIDVDVGVDVDVDADADIDVDEDPEQYVSNYPRCQTDLPYEVEIVKEEAELFGDDCNWSGDYSLEDDCGNEDDCNEDDDCEGTTESSTAAWKHYNTALVYAESELYEQCLEHLESGLGSLVQEQQKQNGVLYWTMKELRAQVWGRVGWIEKSLKEYQGILAHACESDTCSDNNNNNNANNNNNSSADKASLLYTCGKLSVSLNQFEAAVDYYLQELEITKVQAAAADGACPNNLAVARIYHELARVSVKGLGDREQALGYYRDTLQVEMAVRKELLSATAVCSLCCHTAGKKTVYCYCASHAPFVQEVQQQIQDTKRSMGRIHFEQGELEQAVRFLRLM